MNRLSILILVVLWMILAAPLTGTVHAQAQGPPIPIQCGTIIEGEFTVLGSQEQPYTVPLAPGDKIQATVEALGDLLFVNVGIFSPGGDDINSDPRWHTGENYRNPIKTLDTGELFQRGDYTLNVMGGDLGLYTLRVGCTLRDGTVIEPGEGLATFSGYGFPGLAPIEFGGIVEIPMVLGQVYTNALGSNAREPVLYTYEALANTSIKFSVRRISGDLSIGVAIVNQDDNDLVFLAGLPFTDSLSIEITFPNDGIYTIGVFRLDIPPNQIGSSGAFEIQLR